jgi:hypothetical protein
MLELNFGNDLQGGGVVIPESWSDSRLAGDMNFDWGSEDVGFGLAVCGDVVEELRGEVFWKDQESGTTMNNVLRSPVEIVVGGP